MLIKEKRYNMNTYSVLYKTSIQIFAGNNVLNIPTSDIVSLTFINQYDTMTFPIIRIRLYTDLSIIQYMTDDKDNISANVVLHGGVYSVNEDNKTTMMNACKDINFNMKVYIQNKNIPSSKMDQYVNGMKKENDLNNNVKIPIELFGYNQTCIHNMKKISMGIYKDMSLASIVTDMFNRADIRNLHIDPFDNQNKLKQVLLPNLNISDSLSFIETTYGLHRKGTQIFGDTDKMYISNMNVNASSKLLPIYVASTKNNTNSCGMIRVGKEYRMYTMGMNVSVLSQSDLESTLNGKNVVAVNVNTNETTKNELDKLNKYKVQSIDTPNILHKTHNPFVTDFSTARINERLTRIDVAGSGFDISDMKINTRYNLIFETPSRGEKINERYRASYVCHVLSNIDADKFIAQTTMNLCSN